MKPNRLLLIYISLLTSFHGVCARNLDEPDIVRPVTSSYVFNIGKAELADTYLSPIIYRGWNTGFSYSRMQAMGFSPEKWVMNLEIGADIARGHNFTGNSLLWQTMINARWAMTHRWHLPYSITLAAGGYTGLNGGALYLRRNGNNPVAGKAAWNVGLRCYATYPFRVGKIKMLARWQGTMPVAGIFFSPNYGELYYEIWLGNHEGLVHGSWWGNYFQLDNEITLDIFCRTNWLRIGYRSNVLSTKVNYITTRIISNEFIIGLSGEWISLRSGQSMNPNTRVISAIY